TEAPRPSERRRGEVRGAPNPRQKLERETGIEPATNSLEGCDSTTELLPQSHLEIWKSGNRVILLGAGYRRRIQSARGSARRPDFQIFKFPNFQIPFGGEGRTRTFEGARPT